MVAHGFRGDTEAGQAWQEKHGGQLVAVRACSGWLQPRGGQEAVHGTISEAGL